MATSKMMLGGHIGVGVVQLVTPRLKDPGQQPPLIDVACILHYLFCNPAPVFLTILPPN